MSGKIIAFGEGAEMLFNKAMNCIDEGDVMKAVTYLKKCVDMEPENLTYSAELALLYSQSDLFEKSNEIIARYLLGKDDMPPEVYVAMGVNAAAADNPDKAKELLEHYLDVAGEGAPYAEDAEGMLDAIEDYDYSDVEMHAVSVPSLTFDGNKALNDGKISEAMALYEQSDEKDPNRPETLMPLALTYFGSGMTEKGMEVLEKLVKVDPQNVDALCNYVLFANRTDKMGPLYTKRLEYLKKYKGEEPDKLRKILLVLCDLKEHAAVLRFAKRLALQKPYDAAAHHFVATAYYMTGNTEAAREEWRITDDVADGSVVARYYLAKYKDDPADAEPPMYVYQLPYRDMMTLYSETTEALEQNKPLTEDMCLFVKWMLEYANPEEKMMFLMRTAVNDNEKLMTILRSYFLSEADADEVRAFGAGLFEAYHQTDVYICQGGIPEQYSECRRPEFDVYVDALAFCCDKMRGRYTDFYRALLRLFRLMIDAEALGTEKTRPRNAGAVAAAMEYVFATFSEKTVTAPEVATLYHSTAKTVMNRVNWILDLAEQETKDETD